MKLRFKIAALFMAAAVCFCAFPAVLAGAEENAVFPTDDTVLSWRSAGTNGAVIYEQKVLYGDNAGKNYFFLPSAADVTALTLFGPAGMVLTGNAGSLTMDGTVQTVDLSALFADGLQPQKTCEMTVSYKTSSHKTYVMCTGGLSSLYIRSDKTVAELNGDRTVAGSGDLTILSEKGKVRIDQTGMSSIKGRGNSSWFYSEDKKPYNLKLASKAELIKGAGSAKKWSLLSDAFPDTSALYNYAAFEMYQQSDGQYAVSYLPVDFYLNGEYRGVYTLTQKVDAYKTCVDIDTTDFTFEDEEQTTRVIQSGGPDTPPQNWDYAPRPTTLVQYQTKAQDSADEAIAAGIQAYQYASRSIVEKAGGFLVEVNARFHEEATWFVTAHGVPVSIKEPEFASKEQVVQIAAYVQQYENALFAESGMNADGRRYDEYMDMESMAELFTISCGLGNTDLFFGNYYLSVSPDEEGALTDTMYAGPLWDFDFTNCNRIEFFPKNIEENKINDVAWGRQLMTRGEFVSAMGAYNEDTLRLIWQWLNQDGLQNYIDLRMSSEMMNEALWSAGFITSSGTSKKLITNRYTYWYDGLWKDTALMGVTVQDADGVLTAQVSGTAARYEWYRYDAAAGKSTRMDGADGKIYEPSADGLYYVKVFGDGMGTCPDHQVAMTGQPVVLPTGITGSLPMKNGVVSGIRSGDTAEDLIAQMDHPTHLRVVDKAGNVSEGKPLQTGDVLEMTVAGKVIARVTIAVRGDADGDGAVTSADGRMALEIQVGHDCEEWEKQAADMDGDGTVTSADARLILIEAISR